MQPAPELNNLKNLNNLDNLTNLNAGFDEFYRDHRAKLVATLNAATRCGADAATDAVDEAFVRALANWRRVERMDAPAGYVFTVARNQLRRTKSRQATERHLLDQRAARSSTAVHDPAQPAWELWDAVAALPDRERLAVALRYLGDLTERQVAEVMRIAPGTVAATLSSARKRLTEHVNDQQEVSSDGRS